MDEEGLNKLKESATFNLNTLLERFIKLHLDLYINLLKIAVVFLQEQVKVLEEARSSLGFESRKEKVKVE